MIDRLPCDEPLWVAATRSSEDLKPVIIFLVMLEAFVDEIGLVFGLKQFLWGVIALWIPHERVSLNVVVAILGAVCTDVWSCAW